MVPSNFLRKSSRRLQSVVSIRDRRRFWHGLGTITSIRHIRSSTGALTSTTLFGVPRYEIALLCLGMLSAGLRQKNKL